MVIVLELTISTNGVPAEELVPVVVLELPRPPAVVAPLVLDVLVLDELLLVPETLEVEPAETESPLERPAVEAIVPLIGAYSLVSANADLALWTLCSALSTAACAVGMLPADEVEVPEPDPAPDEPPPPAAAEPPAPEVPGLAGLAELVVVCVGRGLGTVGVEALAAVELDEVVVVVVVVGAVLVPVLDVVVGAVLGVLDGVVVTSETNSVVPAPEGWSDAFVVVELPSAEASWSWAAARVCSA